jgi:CubicO group peptidase (beta-lactamase class C family)
MRYSAGLMLGDAPFGVWGPDSSQAFGHLGLVNKFAWADPERELSASLLTTGLPILSHHVLPMVNVMRTIARRTPRLDNPAPFALSMA